MSEASEKSDKNELINESAENKNGLKIRLANNIFSCLTISKFSPTHKTTSIEIIRNNDPNPSPITFKNKLLLKEKESSEQIRKAYKLLPEKIESFPVLNLNQ